VLHVEKSAIFADTIVVIDVCHDGFLSQQIKRTVKSTFNSGRKTSSSVAVTRVRAVLLVARFPATLEETGSLTTLWTRTCLLEIPYANSNLYNRYSFLFTTASLYETWSSTHAIFRL